MKFQLNQKKEKLINYWNSALIELSGYGFFASLFRLISSVS